MRNWYKILAAVVLTGVTIAACGSVAPACYTPVIVVPHSNRVRAPRPVIRVPAPRPAVHLVAQVQPVPPCPAPMTCTYSPQMVIDMKPGNDLHSVAAWADGYGSPIAWINGITAGFYFLGDGNGRERICITFKLQAGHDAACLLSNGTLELRATGPGGSLGPPEFLTAQDIAAMHRRGM